MKQWLCTGVVEAEDFRTWAWICGLVACVWALLMLMPMFSHEGWPRNHDEIAPVLRMAAVLGQWEAGHLIPVWSTGQQFGYGSPMPGLYHKTHLYLSAAVLGVTASVKAALLIPLYLLMVLGFCGMCFCLRHALDGRNPWLWLLGGATLLASNYAVTDWAVRGAFAEFAAFMVLPWIFAWCLILLGEGRWPVWIGPVLALLALSHSALALFGLLPLILALCVGLGRWRLQARLWIRPAMWSSAYALLMMLPFLLPMVAASRFNQVARLAVFTPRKSGIPWRLYFWDSAWTWGPGRPFMTVQLDIMLLFFLPFYVAMLIWPRRPSQETVSAYVVRDRWNAVFLLGTLLVMAWLQLPQAVWFYELVPGLGYLQFPWRLLAYLTVVLVICACIALSRLVLLSPPGHWGVRRIASTVGATLLLLGTSYPKMTWDSAHYEWFSGRTLGDELRTGDYTAFGEFLPLVNWPAAGNGLLDAATQASNWLNQPPPQVCQLLPTGGQSRERSKGYWFANCAHGSVAYMPVFFAPGMAVSVRGSSEEPWHDVAIGRTCSDPRLQLVLPEGKSEIQVQFPNWTRMVAAGFSRQSFDYRRDCATPAAS